MNYKQIAQTEKYKAEKNQCTVVSASVVFNKPYEEIHRFFADNGRLKNKGLAWHKFDLIIEKLAKKYKYEVKFYKRLKTLIGSNYKMGKFKKKWDIRFINLNKEVLTHPNKNLTLKNFNQYLPRGNYIFGVRSHAVGVVNGVIQDWTLKKGAITSNRVITEIITIEKPRKKEKSFKELNSKMKFSF